MLSRVEHEKSFITSRPALPLFFHLCPLSRFILLMKDFLQLGEQLMLFLVQTLKTLFKFSNLGIECIQYMTGLFGDLKIILEVKPHISMECSLSAKNSNDWAQTNDRSSYSNKYSSSIESSFKHPDFYVSTSQFVCEPVINPKTGFFVSRLVIRITCS